MVGTLAQEVSKKNAVEAAGVELVTKDRVICDIVKDAIDAVEGAVSALSFQAPLVFAQDETAAVSGEIAIEGMNADGVVIVTPVEACDAFYVVAGDGVITIKATDDDAPITEVVFNYLVLDLGTPA